MATVALVKTLAHTAGVDASLNASGETVGVDVRTLPAAEAFQNPDLIRTATNLLPPDITDVHVVDIVGLDIQADGGTHVGSTKQIGRLRVKK
ncbi:hypothetical protein [Streptomyces sp. ISL-100]|uniref:hypothetical protein n=1 Tax=Streptomyces sp. ISL-100 TaxID=2819173 RepID=UPI001BE903E3|nr:hypothetical protein [Streptomyces sp. ISL-100]MBT2400804.1 hypothetical protein [Streptomyces sp. ISL-100]